MIYRSLTNYSNDLFFASYDVENCDKNMEHLIEYFNSSIFNVTLKDDINEYYSVDPHIADISARQKQTFLPPPIAITFDLTNPITLILFAVFMLLLFIVFIGHIQSKSSKSFYCCKMSDNFHGVRVILFVLAVFVLFNNINTSYAYFYGYSIHSDVIFLFGGITSFLIIILNIISQSLLLKGFENNIYENKHIESWLGFNKYKLIFFIIISGSFYCGLSFVNCNLFGLNIFSMKLSTKQLYIYKIQKIKIIFLSFLQLISHSGVISIVAKFECQTLINEQFINPLLRIIQTTDNQKNHYLGH